MKALGKEERKKMKKETDVSRRKFLKGSIIGAGALTAGVGTGLFLPSTAQAAPPVLPLPYCRDKLGNPTTNPASNNLAVLDPDDVRVKAWYYYSSGHG